MQEEGGGVIETMKYLLRFHAYNIGTSITKQCEKGCAHTSTVG